MSEITPQKPLLLLGCGKMGLAMLKGWMKSGISPKAIHIIDPNSRQLKETLNMHELSFYSQMEAAYHLEPSVILLAVKPQTLDVIKPHLKKISTSDSLVISIAVGKTLAYLQEGFTPQQAIIRSMPNTPAQIGQGVTALCANDFTKAPLKTLAQSLLQSIGEVLWIDEAQMDVVSALSGSGPAWLFLLTEAMAKAAIDLGLPPIMAENLARKTIEGSAGLMQAHPDISPAELRQAVTSPKGTTYEAMKILQSDDGWQYIINRAMGASVKRAIEISKES